MAEPKVEDAGFTIELQTCGECFFIASEHALVGTKGIFVMGLQLEVGTPVVVHVWKRQKTLKVFGVVCGHYEDSGLVIQFTEKMESAAREFATLLATKQVSSLPV